MNKSSWNSYMVSNSQFPIPSSQIKHWLLVKQIVADSKDKLTRFKGVFT